MVKYLSQEWLDLGRIALNANGEFRRIARDMNLTIYHVITEIPNRGRVYFWSTFHNGECTEVKLGEKMDVNVILTAPYRIWKQVHDGSIDIVQVILEKKMALEGKLMKGIKILKLAPLVNKIIAEIDTDFNI
ncbi:MAG: hypothetical protein ACTSQI_15245 [Candidatus Helarchaeota archaeon]